MFLKMLNIRQTYSAPCKATVWYRILYFFIQRTLWLSAILLIPVCSVIAAQNKLTPPEYEEIQLHHMAPDSRGGKAYKLIYLVPVPVAVYWEFKTDFDNDFLVKNKYIHEHQFISSNGNIVVTESKYTYGPQVFYRWQTTVLAHLLRLEYVLVNPEETKQRFHYGYIQLTAVKEGTLVTQVAYFDFFGVSLWAAFPWTGGMRDFLFYTARWEQDMVMQLKGRYPGDSPHTLEK